MALYAVLLLVTLSCLTPALSSSVIQVHLNCNTDVKDNIFYFENGGVCTSFPGFGSYVASCAENYMRQYATNDCSGEPHRVIPLDVCMNLDEGAALVAAEGEEEEGGEDGVSESVPAVESSVLYRCYATPSTHAVLEHFPQPATSCVGGAATTQYSKVGYNLNECVSNQLLQNGMYQKNTVVKSSTNNAVPLSVQETFYFDSKCTDEDREGRTMGIPVNTCSTLTSLASRYRVVVDGGGAPATPEPATKSPVTSGPTRRHTKSPTSKPTKSPTIKPTKRLVTMKPSKAARITKTPTSKPTKRPKSPPTKRATKSPTSRPTKRV